MILLPNAGRHIWDVLPTTLRIKPLQGRIGEQDRAVGAVISSDQLGCCLNNQISIALFAERGVRKNIAEAVHFELLARESDIDPYHGCSAEQSVPFGEYDILRMAVSADKWLLQVIHIVIVPQKPDVGADLTLESSGQFI